MGRQPIRCFKIASPAAVLLHGRSKTRIDIRFTAGDQTKFQGWTDGDCVSDLVGFNQRLVSSLRWERLATARETDSVSWRTRIGPSFRTIFPQIRRFEPMKHSVQCGNKDHPQDGFHLFDQGNIDREDPITSVSGTPWSHPTDQPEKRFQEDQDDGFRHSLRNHRNLRSHLIEYQEDHSSAASVCFSDRRAVVFEFCLCSLLMDFHDRVPASEQHFPNENPLLPD